MDTPIIQTTHQQKKCFLFNFHFGYMLLINPLSTFVLLPTMYIMTNFFYEMGFANAVFFKKLVRRNCFAFIRV